VVVNYNHGADGRGLMIKVLYCGNSSVY